MRTKALIGLLVLLTQTVLAAQAASPSAAALAFTCAGCHGTDGSSVGPSSPSIAAMDPDVFIDAMQAYKQDQRNSTIMNRIAKAYSDEQIKGMAWYFAKQRLVFQPQEHDPQLAEGPLLGPAIAIGVGQRAIDRFLRGAVQLAPASTIATSLSEYFLSSRPAGWVVRRTRHGRPS